MPLLRIDADLALMIVAFVWRHLRNTDFMSLAFCCKDADLVFMRRDADLALLIVAFV